MIIRKALKSDINEMRALESSCFDEKIRENFEFVLSSDSYIYFVCEDDNKIVAYAGASISYEQGDILSICVDKSFRGKGLAINLMNNIFEYLTEKKVETLFLEVEEDNIPAIRLYVKLGFKKTFERKNYYGTKSAHIMQKVLKN